MAKFGKQFRRNIIPEWQIHYVSYKKLKKIIKQLSKEQRASNAKRLSENSKETEINMTESEDQKFNFSSRLSQNFELDDKFRRLPYIDFSHEFFDKINQEIKKIYLFYTTLERELYLQINTHLHKRAKYQNFDLRDIHKELEQMAKISLLTASFCKYINDNMMAIKKILKKFDKKFKIYCSDMSIKFLKTKLDDPHSDFNYILQYKIIDEVNVLTDDLMKELVKRYYEVAKNKKIHDVIKLKTSASEDLKDLKDLKEKDKEKEKEQNTNPNYSISISKERESNPNISIANSTIAEIDGEFRKGEEKELKRKIDMKIYEIRKYLSRIDEQSTFRSKIKNINFYVNNGLTIVNNHVKLLHSEAKKSFLIQNEDEELIKIFLSSSNKDFLTKETYRNLSTENKINIIQCFLHTYLYMSIYSICISTNFMYLYELGSKAAYSGMFLGFTHLGSVISTAILSKFITRTYKWPMIISVLFFMIGSLLYGAAFPHTQFDPSTRLCMIGLGRFIIGLGSIRTINRGYLIQFLPKNLINRYSDYYLIAGLIGLASGPLLSLAAIYFDEFNLFELIYFNDYTNPAWFSLIQSLLMLIFVVFFYTEPLSKNFHIFEKEKESNIIITKDEKKMITEIQEKLNQINVENQFSDTNLVACNIKLITNKQQSEFSYVKKSFYILLPILFIARVTNESVLIILPYYLYGADDIGKKNDKKLNIINIIMMLTFFSVIPVYYFFKKLRRTYSRERRVLIYLLIFGLFNSLVIIDLFFDFKIKFSICFCMIINTMYLIESFNGSLLSKIIPSNWKIGPFSVGSFISLIAGSGRTLGCFMQTITASLLGDDYIILLTFSIISAGYVVIILIFLLNYSKLKLKSISRIIKSQSYNNV